jgi:Fic family protein
MLFHAPDSLSDELAVIGLIDDLRDRLRGRVAEPRRWSGSLRRLTFARAVQGSNSIEGYNATLDDVMAVMEDDEPLDAVEETTAALSGYQDALTYVLQLANEPAQPPDESLLRSLHFMMLKHDLRKNPGRWRPGAIFVRREPGNELVYEGPDAELVPVLMAELVDELADDGNDVLVRAAMAHLNLVMIHPFSDGNGRMARCLQTLVLAKGRILAPTFSSIEEYLGRNTQAYYDVLAGVGRGGWHPDNDARPWMRFCLVAHFRQARTLLRRVQESEELWEAFEGVVAERRVPPRTVGALFDAALGFRIRRSTYRSTVKASEGIEVSDLTASRDLKALVDADLLVPRGERRGRLYVAGKAVRDEWEAVRARRPDRGEDDPFAIVGGSRRATTARRKAR